MQPTDGHITQHFGTYPQASGEPWGHTGDDFAGNLGDTVRTIADGTVLYAGEHCPDALADRLVLVRGSTNSGKHVIIQHDGWISISAHLNTIDVRTGQRLTRGQRIGGLGMTGRSTGLHLHYECILEPCSNVAPFGRYNPQLQIAHENTHQEGLTVAQYDEIMSKLNRIEAIVTENQKRIGAVPTVKEIWGHLIWGRTQADPGKNKNNSITVIQELANVRTWQINREDELTQGDVVDAIQDNVVTVEIKGKK